MGSISVIKIFNKRSITKSVMAESDGSDVVKIWLKLQEI